MEASTPPIQARRSHPSQQPHRSHRYESAGHRTTPTTFPGPCPDTLIGRSNLARFRGETGDYAGAVTAYEELLPDLVRVLGDDHPTTLIGRSNLARFRGETGDYAGAVTAYEDLLPDLVRVLGDDHPTTLIGRSNLARFRRRRRWRFLRPSR